MLSCPAGLWMEQLGILGKELDLELVSSGVSSTGVQYTRQHCAS